MLTVIVGANRGIGLELCRKYSERGDVIAVCRRASRELEQIGARIEAGVDVTREADLQGLARRLNGTTIDVLIHNAGILERVALDSFDAGSVRRQFEVNALGPVQTVVTLRKNLRSGSKIGLLTSRMGSIGDNSSGSHYGYRMSKAALNIAGVSLALDLRGQGIAVAILHPGFVRTEMTGGNGHVWPAEAAHDLVARMDALNMENTGTFWHANGEVLPW